MIPARYTYLLVDLCCIIVPFLASFHPAIRFHRQWKFFVLPCLLTAFFFVVWDMIFTHLNVWSFNPHYLLGAYVGNLPVEELAFFVCIPYACSFTYYCCSLFVKRSFSLRTSRIISVSLINLLLILAATHLSHLYTSVTFLLLSSLLLYLALSGKQYMAVFYISFLLILIPFFIANGVLTGSFTNEPVVIYNNAENLGVRMGTIPVEDTFYGMLLLLLNVVGFEQLADRAKTGGVGQYVL